LNDTRSLNPPSFSKHVTLVSIEACNPFRLLTAPRPLPIFRQLYLPG
jgi:hypothetical protein